MSEFEKESGTTVYPISEREVTVRKAIANLARVGLRITGFSVHPMTMMEIVNEAFPKGIVVEVSKVSDLGHLPQQMYCGIPLEQDANEPPSIS